MFESPQDKVKKLNEELEEEHNELVKLIDKTTETLKKKGYDAEELKRNVTDIITTISRLLNGNLKMGKILDRQYEDMINEIKKEGSITEKESNWINEGINIHRQHTMERFKELGSQLTFWVNKAQELGLISNEEIKQIIK